MLEEWIREKADFEGPLFQSRLHSSPYFMNISRPMIPAWKKKMATDLTGFP